MTAKMHLLQLVGAVRFCPTPAAGREDDCLCSVEEGNEVWGDEVVTVADSAAGQCCPERDNGSTCLRRKWRLT